MTKGQTFSQICFDFPVSIYIIKYVYIIRNNFHNKYIKSNICMILYKFNIVLRCFILMLEQTEYNRIYMYIIISNPCKYLPLFYGNRTRIKWVRYIRCIECIHKFQNSTAPNSSTVNVVLGVKETRNQNQNHHNRQNLILYSTV